MLDRATAMGKIFAILMMKWGRACWTSRNGTLYGEKPKIYAITRNRLMAKAKVWK